MGVAVAVLNPQDCLKQPFSRKALISPPSRTKSSRSPNRSNRSPPNRKPRRSPAGSGSPPPSVDKPANRLVSGSVKILKRGEDPPDRPAVAATGLLGPMPEPDPAMQLRVAAAAASDLVGGFYAGSSVCIVSPPPSSLPLPAFFARKVESSTNSEATNALLKMLRLDLE